MADYCNRDDVRKRLRDFTTQVIEDNVIDPRIISAASVIDAKLAHYYAVPFSIPRTDIIQACAIELAAGYVLEVVYRDMSDDQSKVAKELVDRGEMWLKEIRCFKMEVPNETRLA